MKNQNRISQAEWQKVVVEWNTTTTDYPRQNSLHELFSLAVLQYGERVAVVLPGAADSPGKSLSYRELDQQSTALAAYLCSLGVGPGSLAGLYVERSVEMVVAMLAILKQGAAYVPLDPAYPAERLNFMLKDTRASVVLTLSHLAGELELDDSVKTVCLDSDDFLLSDGGEVFSHVQAEATSLACVLYTSGSTGHPKGVEIPHRSIVRLVMNTDYTRFDDSRVFMQLVPVSFDVAEFEIWGALLHGSRCILYPDHGVPDPQQLQDLITRYGVTTLWLTTSLFNTIIDGTPEILAGVEELLIGGEALSVAHIVRAQQYLPDIRLINGYGPTESNITTCYRIPRPFDATLKSVPIGRPIANSRVYILDNSMRPVAVGDEGELYIGGDGLARAYLNRPDITAECFVADPFSDKPGMRLYKTGDRGRYLPDGNIEFVGRHDDQVKIDGHRIELGEIEACIRAHSAVRDAGVVVYQDPAGQKRLVAYVAFAGTDDLKALRIYVEQQLPDYMVPHHWFVLDEIPLTENGKLDRRSLPAPEQTRPELEQLYVAPRTGPEQAFANVWRGLLLLDRVGVNDNFFELGGTSLLSLQCVARLRQKYGIHVPIVDLFEYPTIRELVARQDADEVPEMDCEPRRRSAEVCGIAIIGMAGRFPGAANVDELWRNLCAGEESITFFDVDELDASVPESIKNDPGYVPARGVIDGADQFDAAFFGINPREAAIMDPQQRIFLEVAWQALENSGYDPGRYKGLIGLYAGMNSNTYYANNVVHHRDQIEKMGEFQTMLANEKDYLTTRASFKFGLKGPSINVYTACSTSLTAICQAFGALQDNQCDMALAGGVSVIVPQNSGYLYQQGGMFANDGHCRPFDADATGTTFNSGIGLVMLKREEDARRDGDTIYAVIRGTGLNNDGSGKASFTAPGVDGQAAAIRMAQAQAEFDPASISYIETHGTGTPLGDPIEVAGLCKAFGQRVPKQTCAIGSVKGNLGHLIHAAAVTGVIKTALALKHKILPPSINYSRPNPNIDFDNSPFYVIDKLVPWPGGDTPRRAGVSSFGVGGTNAHIVMEEVVEMAPVTPAIRPRQLLLLSARSEAALDQASANLHACLQNPLTQTMADWADVAYTLQVGRKAFNCRRAIVCRNRADAVEVLASLPAKRVSTHRIQNEAPPVVFMFPGQGTQYVNMGRNLYATEPVFRNAVEHCASILKPLLEHDLLTVLYPGDDTADASALLRQTACTQPALFTVEYALAQLWRSWGIEPEAMIGHSIGEFVAACLAGVFSLEDGLSLVACRARLMQDCPSGTMLSVRLPAQEMESRLGDDMAVAAVNGPALCVISGPTDSIGQLQKALEAEKIVCRPLHTSHAFHSPMMEPVIEPFLKRCQSVQLSAPKIPFVSTVTAEWITDAQATDPRYWARHLRETVRFSEGIQTLWQQPERLLLEVGPRTTTATLARQQAADVRKQVVLSSLGDTADDDREWETVLNAMGQLWLHGVDIEWDRYYQGQTRQRVPLPTYPYEHKSFWLEAPAAEEGAIPSSRPDSQQRDNQQQITGQTMTQTPNITAKQPGRQATLTRLIETVMEDTSGVELTSAEGDLSFLELGFDSLVLTQASLALKNKFGVGITFRQLMEEYTSVEELAQYFDQELPADAFMPDTAAPVSLTPAPDTTPAMTQTVMTRVNGVSAGNDGVAGVINQQLQLMARQLEMLGMPATVSGAAPATVAETASASVDAEKNISVPKAEKTRKDVKKAFGPAAKIHRNSPETLTAVQQKFLDGFIARYNQRTPLSKQEAQDNRACMADPRTVSGFRPVWKEMVYPIVVERSAGSTLWDIDGNDYVDLACGFGSNMFGWAAPFIIEAIKKQLETGYEIGPQTRLAGEVARKVCAMTGNERIAFCNTGSEAVLGAIRLARTVTGRNTIVIFEGGYHGIFDEVIVRGSASLRSLPAAPGIPPEMVKNILVLEYGTPETMAILESRKDELAAILVETVQSRRPDLQPEQFLHQLRELTEQCGAALIFDEVITGFRSHPAGMQGYYGIRADMATYGKVVGGGMPIGLIGGKARFMDALDGGQWQFGDDSIPETGVTFFAGTFVRHPLVLAAANAVMDHLESAGPGLQQQLAAQTGRLANEINTFFEKMAAPYRLPHFTSFFYLTYSQEQAHGGLLFYLLREKGVHIWEGRPCFLTTAHSEADIDRIIKAFKDSIMELQKGGFIPQPPETEGETFDTGNPPVPGARLGKDPEGNPAWYIENPEQPGKYMRVDQA